MFIEDKRRFKMLAYILLGTDVAAWLVWGTVKFLFGPSYWLIHIWGTMLLILLVATVMCLVVTIVYRLRSPAFFIAVGAFTLLFLVERSALGHREYYIFYRYHQSELMLLADAINSDAPNNCTYTIRRSGHLVSYDRENRKEVPCTIKPDAQEGLAKAMRELDIPSFQVCSSRVHLYLGSRQEDSFTDPWLVADFSGDSLLPKEHIQDLWSVPITGFGGLSENWYYYEVFWD